MSKCPDARDCLRDLVVPAMERISDKVDFRLSFIGSYVHLFHNLPLLNLSSLSNPHGLANFLSNKSLSVPCIISCDVSEPHAYTIYSGWIKTITYIVCMAPQNVLATCSACALFLCFQTIQ